MYFNGEKITKDSILKTREWFSENAIACIDEVKAGKFWVNNPEEYFKEQERKSKEYLEGKHDHTVTFAQRAYYIQTGKSIGLLS